MQVMLLAQRAALIPDWCVRLAVPDDMVGVHALIGGLPEGKQLQDSFLQALGGGGARSRATSALACMDSALAASSHTKAHTNALWR